jgi:Cu/Ag efflux protein CusF
MKELIICRAMIGVVLGALVMAGAWEQSEDKIEGEARSVDSESGMLTLSDGKQLAIDPGTRVRKDGGSASLSDIKEGDQVRAIFSPTIAWPFGHKDAPQDRVKQVVATSRTNGSGPVGVRDDAM